MVNACISCSVCTGLKRGDRVYPRKAAWHRYYCTWTSSKSELNGTNYSQTVRTKLSRHSKKARIVIWFSHAIHHDTLSKTVLKGSVDGRRRRGRQQKNWKAKVREWMDRPLHARGAQFAWPPLRFLSSFRRQVPAGQLHGWAGLLR